MTKTSANILEFGDISTDLFLNNISNLPGINVSFIMIGNEYSGYPAQKEIIDHAKVQFLVFCKKIINEFNAMCSKNRIYQPAFDYEELISTKKLVNSLDLSASKLLQITAEKINQLVIFILSLEKHATKIDLLDEAKDKICIETSIARHRLQL